MSSGLIDLIKKIAVPIMQEKEMKILFGKVMSVKPPIIKINERLILTEQQIRINSPIELGESVVVINYSNDNKFMVLSTIEKTYEITNPGGSISNNLIGINQNLNGIKKIYLSPSSQFENKYSYGNTNEAEQCQKIANRCGELLTACGFTVKVGSNTQSISTRISDSNSFGAELHIPIHTNAGGGNGALVLCHSNSTENSFVKSIYNNLCALNDNPDDGIKVRMDLSEITKVKGISVYCECEYHDNKKDARFIVENTEAIARAIANGVVTGNNGAPIGSNPTTPDGQWKNIGIFELTGYCPCSECCGSYANNRPKDANGNPIVYTKSGAIAQQGVTIAVDPTIIPHGTMVYFNNHTYIAQDIGSAIKGNRIDVYHASHSAASQFGRQQAQVYIKVGD